MNIFARLLPVELGLAILTVASQAVSQVLPFGLAAKDSIDLGTSVMIDSFDSSDPLHSTSGLYDPAKRMAGGDVASLNGPVNLQNAAVYGKLRTGPTASYSIGNGFVGDLTWNVPGQIQPGWYENNVNTTFADVAPPFASGVPVPRGSGTNTYVLGSADYYVNSDLVLNNGETMLIAGNTRLYVTGNFTMKNAFNTFLSIVPGGSLKLYIGKPGGTNVAGQFTQVSNTGAFQVFGLNTLKTLTWSGNATFVGNIYAPYADFSFGGGGSVTLDYQGACAARSIHINGHFNFHYDEALGRTRVIIPPSLALELSEGHPLINLNGMLNSNFVVQYSTNFAGSNWMNLLSLTNLPHSPYQFLDPASASEPARFYRALMQ